MVKILVIDHEPRIVKGVLKSFEQAGFDVRAAYDGPSGLSMARHDAPDLVVLDLFLPGIDGPDVCRRLRRASDVPIILLAAPQEVDSLVSLDLDADGCVCKPFNPGDLVARARVILRRVHAAEGRPDPFASEAPEIYRFGDVVFDVRTQRCTVRDRVVILTPTEHELLSVLVRHPGQVLTRTQLMRAAPAASGIERTIDVHIHHLRHKLEPDPAHPTYVLTVFSQGYRFAGRPSRIQPLPQVD